MSSASDYLEVQVGNHVLRSGTFTKPSAIYLALFQTAPGEDNTGGVELSADSYARVQCGPDDANWSEPADGSGEFINLVDFTFPSPVENWADEEDPIIAAGVYDAATGGNLLLYGTLLVAQTVLAGGLPPKFSAGDLKLTVA